MFTTTDMHDDRSMVIRLRRSMRSSTSLLSSTPPPPPSVHPPPPLHFSLADDGDIALHACFPRGEPRPGPAARVEGREVCGLEWRSSTLPLARGVRCRRVGRGRQRKRPPQGSVVGAVLERGIIAGRRHDRGPGTVAASADHHGRAGFLLHASAGDWPGRDGVSPGRRSLLARF